MVSLLLCFCQELLPPFVILLFFCFIYTRFASVNHLRNKSKLNVLFITAHPDDECMFFAPTILSLLRQGHQVYLVCFSKGDFEGLGEVRKKELQASCSKLGILPNHVTVVDDERFKDGPDTLWDIDSLSEKILSVVKRVSADNIITFDDYGVSGHTNHTALYSAAEYLVKGRTQGDLSVFVLRSSPLVRKYTSFLDIPISSIFCPVTFISSPSEVLKAWRAMAAHESQFVWFRMLYIIFSRYMYVNSLREIR